MGDPAPRSIPAQPATPSTHASRAHRHLFSHFSLLSAHSFPSPLALRKHLVDTREAVSHAPPPEPPCSPASSDSSPLSHPGATPACSPSFVGAGLKPASSVRDPSTPTPRRVRALSVPRAAQPSPHGPNLPRRPAKKSGPSYLSPARIPSGDSGWREIAPPSPPPNSRRPAQALSPIRSPQPPLAVPLRTPQPPAQPSPHRPGKTSPTHATPRSARRRPCPGASPLHPKNAPPNLKSFLERSLYRILATPRSLERSGPPGSFSLRVRRGHLQSLIGRN